MRIAWLLLVLLVGGCGDPREHRMRDSLEHAEAQLHQAQMEPLAGNRLRAALEISGTPVDYLVSSVPADTELGPYRWQQPQQPFDVVINGAVDDWQIDGYGETLDKPLVSARVRREP